MVFDCSSAKCGVSEQNVFGMKENQKQLRYERLQLLNINSCRVVYLPHPSTHLGPLFRAVPAVSIRARVFVSTASSPEPQLFQLHLLSYLSLSQEHFGPFSLTQKPTSLYIHSFSTGKNFLKHTNEHHHPLARTFTKRHDTRTTKANPPNQISHPSKPQP